MGKQWQGCLLALILLAWGAQVQAQENPERIAAIIRDMETRAMVAGRPMQTPAQSVIQVAAVEPVPQSILSAQSGPIPEHLLPEIYSSSSPAVPAVYPPQDIYQSSWNGDRFMFSSAFQRRINPPRGDFSNVPDDCGSCDEWQTFMPCESCCRDLGLNPWVVERARPNCPPDWWRNPNCSNGNCNDCNSGLSQPVSPGLLKHGNW